MLGKDKIEKMLEDPKSPQWVRHVALLTGVLAALAGYLTVRMTQLSDDAIYRSNQGVLYQAQASNAWAYYQASSIKARIVETALLTTTDAKARAILQKEADELRERQPEAKADAEKFQHQRDERLKDGEKFLHEKGLLSYASVATQLAIALASVAALTRRYVFFRIAIAIGVASILIAAYAILGPLIGLG